MFDIFSFVTFFIYAFLLGISHAFEADHIAAITAFSPESGSVLQSSKLGAFWGMGHTAMLLLVGGTLLLLKITIPETVAIFIEGIVGMVLVFLGVSVLWRIKKDRLHIHTHTHGKNTHTHLHSHKRSFLHKHEHKSFLVGLIHGLAGSGALVLLILVATDSVIEGFVFILVFGVGSILGMMLISSFIGYLMQKANGITKLYIVVQYTAGIFSVAIGILLIVKSFFL